MLYSNLLTLENPSKLPEGDKYENYLNPESVECLTGCKLEPSLADAEPGLEVSVCPHRIFLRGHTQSGHVHPHGHAQGRLQAGEINAHMVRR